ncbi:hypothetical protein ACQP2P_12680 [Dactylosporangium sp. CA-139114]|uniref:hypothetical protein n=1 Tax=Dactylosporangium sp. CA-139114 TaxID=3239931 RepID=UPI003D970A67
MILTLAFIDHYVFHRSFVYVLVFIGSVVGPVVWRRLEEAAQRRRTRAQQAPNGAERDASGG